MSLRLRKALHRGAFFIALSSAALPAFADCLLPTVERKVDVAGVVDGDTLRLVDGNSVRLIGVNTPELGRDGGPDQPGARQARQALERWTQGRALGVTEGMESRDRYGRLLAHLSVDGASLSERLVRQGLGFAVAIPPDLRLSDCLFDAERRARQERVGLWRADPVRSAADLERGGFALVTGRVTKLDAVRRAYYLEVDDHLVLRVDRRLVGSESEAWLLSLSHRQVEVRGWVVDRGRDIKPGRKRWLIGISDLRHMKLIGG